MGELDDLRVRLEGALETVEATTAEMVAAAQELKKGRAARVMAAVTASESEPVNQALAAVQRLAASEPPLARVAERFIAAREAMRATTLARGAELGFRSMPVALVAEALGEFPVLYSGRAIDPRALVGGAMFFAALTAVSFTVHLVFMLFPLALLLAVAAFIARSPRLVVTRARVRAGATLVAVRGVESVLVSHDLMSHQYSLRFRLRDGGMVEVELPALPTRFGRALEQVTTVEYAG